MVMPAKGEGLLISVRKNPADAPGETVLTDACETKDKNTATIQIIVDLVMCLMIEGLVYEIRTVEIHF